MKKEIERLADAHGKMISKNHDYSVDPDTFSIGFTTDNFQCTTNDGKVSVTAKINKKDFDTIIYSYGLYVIEYLKEKKLI
jgi:hypothetical protein